MKITPEQMALTGVRTTLAGAIESVWSFADDKTGEVNQGVKLAWFGGNGSVAILDDKVWNTLKTYEDQGSFVVIEVTMQQKKDGSYRMGRDAKVVELDGKKFSFKN